MSEYDPYDPPTKIAFCKILHAANGGQFHENGKPVFDGTRGLCDEPYDCGNCGHFQRWVRMLQQKYIASWECQTCVRMTQDTYRSLQGYYHEGFCQRCGFNTPLLQFVLRSEVLPIFPWPLNVWPPPDED